MRLDLNVFSNVASPDPTRCLVPEAVRSVEAGLALGDIDALVVRVFVDPNPHPHAFEGWCAAIRAGLPGRNVEIVRSRGLADGYALSLERSEGGVALQWEHDFVLVPGRVRHTASEIAVHMKRLGIEHLRLNKRMNRVAGYDQVMRPVGDARFSACRVTGRSNNPHFVDVVRSRETVLPLIDRGSRGPEGLEWHLCALLGGGHVYGPLGHPPAIRHLDGRDATLAGKLARLAWRAGLRR